MFNVLSRVGRKNREGGGSLEVGVSREGESDGRV